MNNLNGITRLFLYYLLSNFQFNFSKINYLVPNYNTENAENEYVYFKFIRI